MIKELIPTYRGKSEYMYGTTINLRWLILTAFGKVKHFDGYPDNSWLVYLQDA
jgi:hypothetical protein